jgi:hypothetical protein
MKLVQMPIELLHLEEYDLPERGVDERLLAGFEAYRSGVPNDGTTGWARAESLAILAPPEAGTRELLMVVARRVGAALRDENIHLRDRGGDLKAGRRKLCYLPGGALPEALRTPSTRRGLEREAACFLQDLDAAWVDGEAEPTPLPSAALLALLDTRLAGGRATFLSADPRHLPPGLDPEIRGRMRVLEPR